MVYQAKAQGAAAVLLICALLDDAELKAYRELPGCDRETLLVLDATTGQNGLIQAKQFKEAAGITGIVLTKLDGSAKGGIVIAIAQELQVPVKFIGVGEGIDDLMPFEAEKFVEALV